MSRPFSPLAPRFWAKVKVGDPNECWPWIGSIWGNSPYGQLSYQGHLILAHRASWIIHRGAITEGMEICHTCDNPKCVNPAHLWMGTHQENMQDMVRKGRKAITPSAESSTVKLTETDVIAIRGLLQAGLSQRTIASKYGVTSPTICCINTRKTWKQLK